MPTIREVAQRANVSPTTVSHVINNTRFVSAGVRARVLKAMEELGYRPNALARSLRRGQTFTIGLILPDSSNPYFAEIGRGIEASAFESNYSVILCNTEGDFDKEQLYVDVLIKKQVDGMIFVAAGDRPDSLYALLNRNLPVVMVDRNLPGISVDAVLADNRMGGYLATQHLIELGHQRIGCIAGPSNLTPSGERVTGYRQALTEAGLAVDESLILPGDFQTRSGHLIAQKMLEFSKPPTALFASNDLMAIGALRAAAQKGCRVPDDLAVVGFDDIELAQYATPPLTTVIQPKIEMGRTAVNLLIERMKDKERSPQTTVLPTRLIIRESCGGQP